MDDIDAVPRGLCGWEERFTDFDSWICKLNRHLNRRSSRVIQSVGFSLEDSQIQNATRDAIAGEEKGKENKLGHGKSNPFPVGVLISQAHQIEAVRRVVEYFKWDKFVYFTHSVGFAIGVLYNFLYPFEIIKAVNLDPVPPLSTYCFHEYSPMLYYQYHYDDYYDNYSRWELHRNKQYTYDQAIQLLVRSRKLTKEQSAVVLSRTLIPLGNGMFKLSWEPTMKKVVGVTVTEDTLSSIVTTNAPPMLNIVASIDETIKPLKKNGVRLMNRFQESIPNCFIHYVIGTHDVHITNPESFVDKIIDFLNTDFTSSPKAKL